MTKEHEEALKAYRSADAYARSLSQYEDMAFECYLGRNKARLRADDNRRQAQRELERIAREEEGNDTI